jgi:glycosyltransferase involved in cell wall biosynthesis
VQEAYRHADLFVLPCVVAPDGSRDVTPNALIEAMAMQLPVVSTPVGGIPEIVEHGVSGLLVPPGDPDALRDALAELAADAALRERLGRQARVRVTERFDLTTNMRRFAEAFQGLGA